MVRPEGSKCPEGRGPGQCRVVGEAPGGPLAETIHCKLWPLPVPLTSCHGERGRKRDQALPSSPLAPSLRESCLIGATGHSSCCHWFFLSRTPRTPEALPPRVSRLVGPRAGRDPGPQLPPAEGRSLGASVCLRGQHAAPSAPGTKDASGQKGSLSSPSDEGFSLQTAVAAGEREGFYLSQFSWVFGIAVFPGLCLALVYR